MPNLHPDEAQISTVIAKNIKAMLSQLKTSELRSYRAILETLIYDAYTAKQNSRQMVDTRASYRIDAGHESLDEPQTITDRSGRYEVER